MASLREKFNQGVTFGTWLAVNSSQTAEIMGQIGFDWVIIDTQHGGPSEAHLVPMIQAVNATGTPVLVRVNWLDEALIMRAGDIGADGVVIPMVNTPEDAQRAVQAIRYPPKGIRSFGPMRNYYVGDVQEEPLCLCMIETVEAFENLEKIAATPGLDGLLVGPADLALSMGIEFSMSMSEQVLDAIEKVASVCKQHGLLAASVVFNHDNAAEQIRRGVNFVASGADSLYLRSAATADLEQLKKIGSGS